MESPSFAFCSFPGKGEGESRGSGLTGEDRVAAIVCYTALPVQTHPAQDLLKAAFGIYYCREAAGFGSGG